MTKDLLQGIHITALLQKTRGERMPEQMSAQTRDSGLYLEPAEHQTQRVICHRRKIPLQENSRGACRSRLPGEITQKQLARVIAKRNDTLLVAFFVHDSVTFGDVQPVKSKRYDLVQP